MSDWLKEISLYVHLPWCVSKCPYCDFNSFQHTPFVQEDVYIDALLRDLEEEIRFSPQRTVSSIYFGGGTPSLFTGDSIMKLTDGLSKKLTIASDAEITLEVNPESSVPEKLRQYRVAGINRISIGVQSFSDQVLTAISRPHNAEDARKSFSSAREVGFDNINIDLMYGVPAGSKNSDLLDLKEAISLGPEHISRYQLTLEQGTRFFLSPPDLPNEDEIYRSFAEGFDLLSQNGYLQYEVSAYSQPQKFSRHNLHYWRYGDYIGIGAGAHGKTTRGGNIYRVEKPKSPSIYMAKFSSHGSAIERKIIDHSDALIEYAINATRLVKGFEVEQLFERTGIRPDSIEVSQKLKSAEDRGFLTREGGLLKPTFQGRLFLDDLQLIFL